MAPARNDAKARIAETAIDLYRAGGRKGVTMRRLGATLGISATALYRHYPNQHAILGLIADAGFEALGDRMEQPFASEDPRERVLEIVDRYVVYAHEEPRIYDLMLRIQFDAMRVYPRDYVAGKSRTANVLIRELRRGVEERGWRITSVAETLLSIWALGHGLTSLFEAGRIEGSHEEFRALVRRATEGLLDGISA